jgi:hypothetical protein
VLVTLTGKNYSKTRIYGFDILTDTLTDSREIL